MPQFVENEQGEQVEVYTSEELQAQKEAALEEYKKEKDAELDAAQTELKLATEKLGKLEGKDLNFAKLREQKQEAEDKVERVKQEMEESLGKFKKEILEGVSKDYYNETLGSLAGDDAELKKKIEFEYNRLNDPVNTKEDISKKLRDAYILATKLDDSGALSSSAVSSGGSSKLKFKQDNKFTPEEVQFAKKLAASGGIQLKDEDFK